MRQLFKAWRSLRREEAAIFCLAGLLLGSIDLFSILELQLSPDIVAQLPGAVARHLLAPLLATAVMLLCWLPVARSDPLHPRRPWRLFAVTVLGAVLAMTAHFGFFKLVPLPSFCDLYSLSKDLKPCSVFAWTKLAGDTLWLLLPALLLVFMIESMQQRRRHEDAAHALLLEHSQLKRQAVAARLAALQARMEPDHLFAALIDIEQAYAQGRPDAGERIERLITELRQALLDARALNPT